MTDEQIEAVARGLTTLERKKILRARYDGADYVMRRGDSRGFHGRGLVCRLFDCHTLSETGVEVRDWLLKNKDDV